ncbi:MBL fold metallo-hydrolase [Roseomonas xinghualingensis]|uniref:MBL fold metallo-hydrolase n=1 Tax=Roseomonas xinghualingensis TaxID=2986475 RepID=UPI0021F24532|nr:MBL fold metallo-hydrolase [Roseomonas sp. SXEYE001]MCV4209958.1 MBL fold metallo-hydrolase [Roseomonas sp. SXEYE001]
MFFRRTGEKAVLKAEVVHPGRRRFLALGCACCAAAALPAIPASAAPAGVQRHLDLARQAASSDLGTYLRLGNTALTPPAAPQINLAPLINQPVPPPGQAFDNLYFVGARWVSAWVIRTSAGLILIDALNNNEEAERVIDAGMRRLGLDPSEIKIVVVTHGHGDHYGGIGHIKRVASPKVIMSDADWTMMATKLEFDAPEWGRPPQRDVSVADGERIVLGDTSIEVLETPGHTLGTLSLLFTVRQGRQEHRALLWGGTAFNFGAQPDRLRRLRGYIDATARVRDIARQQKVDVFISNHAGYDEAIGKLATKQSANTNPFVIGTETTMRALTVMNECAQATMEAWKA